jgi:hypothetical protein
MLDAIVNRTELRLQLLRNQYTPLPNVDKVCKLPSWPTIRVDEALIRRYARSLAWQSTGLRIEHGLVAIDGDILDGKLAQRAWEALPKGVLRRVGKFPKWMALARLDPSCGPVAAKLRSHSWTDGADKHQVEIFTGGHQQIGAFGWHTLNERRYTWIGPSPLDVPLHKLQPVTALSLVQIRDGFDALAEGAGLTRLVETKHGKNRVYDITDETRFSDNAGRTGVTLAELEQNYFAAAHVGRAYRVASPWTGDGRNVEKCLVGWSPKHDCVTVHDFPYDTTHLPARFGSGSPLPTALVDFSEFFKQLEGSDDFGA